MSVLDFLHWHAPQPWIMFDAILAGVSTLPAETRGQLLTLCNQGLAEKHPKLDAYRYCGTPG